ncbi:MAG: AMP-binding protein, partial [Nocardia sp.]|nr:AMP-binding protein [Nocardia sp.]
GTAIAGRGERALDDLVGMFVNTLTLRTGIDIGADFDAAVDTARDTDLAAFAHADIPFERVAEVLTSGRGGAQSLFTVVLSFANTERPSLELPGLTVTALDPDTVAAKFDLMVTAIPRREADGGTGELGVSFTYAGDLFDAETMRVLSDRFEKVLTAVAADPRRPLTDIELGIPAPAAPTPAAPPEPVTGTGAATSGTALAQALVAAVEADPEGPALTWGEELVTYEELDTRSSRLARVLIGRGCGPGTGVALRLDRGVEQVVAVWAVLKAGAAVVPVTGDDLPDATIAVGICESAPGTEAVDWMVLSEFAADIAAQSARPVTYADRIRPLDGADPAFIGPDGPVGYDELAAAVDTLCERTELTFESRTFHQGHGDHIAVLLEVVAAGITGASMVLARRPADTGALADEWVTHLFTDRAGLDRLDPAPLEDLRAVLLESGQAPSEFGAAEVVVLPEDVLR